MGRPVPSLCPLAVLVGLWAAGCAAPVQMDGAPQAYYQTAFPRTDTSERLERILSSVARISVTTGYETFLFPADAPPSPTAPIDDALLAQAVDTAFTRRTRMATAVLVARQGRALTLLTVNHAVHAPDTVIQYYERSGGGQAGGSNRQGIRSVAILRDHVQWLIDLPDLTPFQVLARDPSNDLALLGARTPAGTSSGQLPVLPVAPGRPDRLSWGSFVYVIGYPGGFPMVGRGIVSDPEGRVSGSFVTDGLWNEGMSGGLILAVRGDDESLEWVGTARAAAAELERRLGPVHGAEETLAPWEPYEGPVFLEEVRRIRYGITLSVSVDTTRRFVDEHRGVLQQEGFPVPRL
jgi:hypothetical protein